MGKKGGGGRGHGAQRPIKGFRPGKAPKQLKKQMAKAQLGSDASWVQKQTVEAVAGKSPQEVGAQVRTWTVGVVVGAVLLGVLGVFLYAWSLVAGVVVHGLTVGLLFLAYRFGKQGQGLAELAKSL
jgi:hypothetical protein